MKSACQGTLQSCLYAEASYGKNVWFGKLLLTLLFYRRFGSIARAVSQPGSVSSGVRRRGTLRCTHDMSVAVQYASKANTR